MRMFDYLLEVSGYESYTNFCNTKAKFVKSNVKGDQQRANSTLT